MNRAQITAKIDQMLTKSLQKQAQANQTGTRRTKVVLLSFDALSADDWTTLRQYPNFNKLISQASFSKSMKSVYPSMTYPAHATVMTGRLPRKHGIVSNTKLQPTRPKPDWHWYHREIHGKTLFSEAHKNKLSVSAILWPVSAGAPSAFNMPEIFPNRPWLNQMSVSLLNGSKRFQIQMDQRHGKLRKGLKQPQLDDFAHACALDTLKTYQPDLLMVHYTELDTQKHNHGTGSLEAKEAIKRFDQRLEDYFRAFRQLGIEEEVSLIVFGDHGSKDVHSAIRPNVILQKEGFLSVEENGRLHRCDYIFKTCDGSAYLYHDNLHKVSRELLRQELEIIITALEKHNEQIQGIEVMRTGSEAGYEGADAHALLMLEAKEGFYFLEDYEGELLETVPIELAGTAHWLRASHGYHPETPNYESVCFAYGSRFEKGEMGEINLVDLGPSIAHLLGLSLGDTDGQPLWK